MASIYTLYLLLRIRFRKWQEMAGNVFRDESCGPSKVRREFSPTKIIVEDETGNSGATRQTGANCIFVKSSAGILQVEQSARGKYVAI